MFYSNLFRAAVLSFIVFAFQSRISLAADLSLVPSASTGSYSVGQIFTVPIFVTTSSGEAINAVSSIVSFPAHLLQLVSIDKSGTIIDFWIGDSTYSNADGKASFEGGVYNPGFNGPNGKIVSLVFKAKASGVAALSFSSASVLANDGRGTNVLNKTGTASVSIIKAPPVEATTNTSSGTMPEIAVNSSSHPDQSKWYSSGEVSVSWKLPPGTTAVKTGYDSSATGDPIALAIPPITDLNFTIPSGVSYFHLQGRDSTGWGKVSHFKIQVDLSPLVAPKLDPLPKKITEGTSLTISGTAEPENLVTIKVEGSSGASGGQSVKADSSGRFTVIWGSHLASDVYNISAQSTSLKNLVSPPSENIVVIVEPSALLRVGWPLLNYLTLGFISLLLCATFIAWVWYLTHRVRTFKKRVTADIKHADSHVHARFKKLENAVIEQIKLLRKEEVKRKLTAQEEGILGTLAKYIEDAEDDIENEIKDIGR